MPYIRFNTEMVESRWDAAAKHWVIKTNNDTYHATIPSDRRGPSRR